MKRLLIFICLLFACYLIFAEIKRKDAEKNDDGITSYATCTTKKEVLEVTHWKDLDSYFISYTIDPKPSEYDVYLVIFMNLGTMVYEYHKGSKSVACYCKTILE